MFATQVDAYAQQKLITGEPVGKRDRYDTDNPLYRELAALGKLRAEHPALARGAQFERYADDGPGVYAMSRVDRDQRIEHLVALNNADQPRTVTLTSLTPRAEYAVLHGETGPVTADADGSVTITVPALSSIVLRADRVVAAPESAQTIKVAAPTPGAALTGLTPLSAAVDRDLWQETSFGWRVAGEKDWRPLGTSDSTVPSVRHDVGGRGQGDLDRIPGGDRRRGRTSIGRVVLRLGRFRRRPVRTGSGRRDRHRARHPQLGHGLRPATGRSTAPPRGSSSAPMAPGPRRSPASRPAVTSTRSRWTTPGRRTTARAASATAPTSATPQPAARSRSSTTPRPTLPPRDPVEPQGRLIMTDDPAGPRTGTGSPPR